MKTRSFLSYVYVIAYLMLLRVIINITVGISVFSLGILFDLVLAMFWVGIFAFFFQSKLAQKIYYIIVVVFSSVFIIADSIYHDYFGVISARSSLSGIKWLQENDTLDDYSIQIPLVAYMVAPLLILVIYLIITNKKKDVFFIKEFLILSGIFVVQVGLFLHWGNLNFDTKIDFYRSDAYLFETMHDRKLFSEKYGYFNYHMLDLTRLRGVEDEDELYAEVDEFFNNIETHEANDYSDLYEGYNVITILGETLETRFIDPVLTPNLYQMKSNGLSFDNYYTPVYQQGATCNSEYMSITGLGAITTNDWSSNICDSNSENLFTYSLTNQLENIGYESYYFHSGNEGFYNRKTFVPNYGFNTVKFQEDLIDDGYPDFNDRFDTEMIYFFDEYVDYSEPFYIDLLTYSMHGAYDQVEFNKYDDRVAAAYPNQTFDSEIENYMKKLVEFDNMLGLIMDRLEENGQLDNTLFAIFPDHYPYMMDYQTYEDHIGVKDDFHEVMRQELIIYATNMTGEVIHTAGSTVDITPTLLNLLNSNSEFGYFSGNDLLGVDENYILFADLTITDGENILYLNEFYDGDPAKFALLEAALEDRINALEIQKKLLTCNYFIKKETLE